VSVKRLIQLVSLLAIAAVSAQALADESCVSPAPAVFEPSYAGIEELHAAIESRRISVEQLVCYYLRRIDRLDQRGPQIHALISVNPNALERARRLDALAGGRQARSLLFGIPFVAKDSYNTAGIPTTGGSAALRSSVPAENAFVVQRLLDEGAVLIGKANMSELAASFGRLGYSAVGGQTRNPYNTARDVSGSSSGSAAALAADFAVFGLGTDTSGSIRDPASVAGLVGLRPTFGLISRTGVMPSAPSFDATGALTRSVRDQAIVLDAIAGVDPLDPATRGGPTRAGGYRAGLMRTTLKGVRLGVIGNFRGGNAEVDALERSVLSRLESLGAKLEPLILPAEFERLWNLVLEPADEAEFKAAFEHYLGILPPDQPKTLAALIAASAADAVHSAIPINPRRLEALRRDDASRSADSPAYARVLTEIVPAVRAQLAALAEEHHLDAFVFATMSCPASPRYDRPDPSYVCQSEDPYKASYIAPVAGYPEVTVPAGRISANMPIGYSFMGLPHTERQLLDIAGVLEAARPRPPPPPLD